MSVVRLIPNNALCVDAESIAARLREVADRVEAGEWEGLSRAVVVLDADSVDWLCYGRQTSLSEVVGLLEWAKLKVIL